MKRVLNQETGRKFNDLTGDVFGKWTVIAQTGQHERGQSTWLCQCACGKSKQNVLYGALVAGTSKSCGCVHKEQLSERAFKHGMSGMRIHQAWAGMHSRCTDKTRKAWPDYGGRGITVCERWSGQDGFANFYADMGNRPQGTSVDRRNNDKGYSPDNCRWATKTEQASNKRNNRFVEYNGQRMTITDLARLENVALCSLRNRILISKDSPQDAVKYCQYRFLVFKERNTSFLTQN